MRILIIKPSSLGDIIHSFPAVHSLKKSQENLHISWVVNSQFTGILSMLPGIDRIIPFPRKEIGSFNLKALKAFLADLRRESYDYALDFQGLLRSALIAKASKSKIIAGFANAREAAGLFYNEKIKLPSELKHAVDKNNFLVQKLFNIAASEIEEPVLQVKQEWLDEAKLLAGTGKGPLLTVGFSSRWESKIWSENFFAAVINELLQKRSDLTCCLIGSPGERAAGDELCKLLPESRVINLAGKTTMETLIGLLKNSSAFLSNDSGPMHIAAALQTPCIALFGATDPELTGPYGKDRHLVITSKCEHSPCFKKICPFDKEKCPEGISAEETAQRILSVVSG